MNNRTLSSLLFTLYNIGLFGTMLAVPGLVFLVFAIPNPNATGRILISVALASAIVLISLAVGGRIALRLFYDRACGRAFAQWEANPGLGEAVNAVLLAELAGFAPQDAWHARQFLERKAAKIGLGYQEADEPNHRRYRFPRPAMAG